MIGVNPLGSLARARAREAHFKMGNMGYTGYKLLRGEASLLLLLLIVQYFR